MLTNENKKALGLKTQAAELPKKKHKGSKRSKQMRVIKNKVFLNKKSSIF